MLFSVLTVLGLSGCSRPDYTGTWYVDGSYDLSGPFAGDRTMGEGVAHTVIAKSVELSPVPGFLQDEAREVLEKTIGQVMADAVDPSVPETLQPRGEIYTLLGTSLASIEVKSSLNLERGGGLTNNFEGTETVDEIAFQLDDASVNIDPQDLFEDAGAAISADWIGDHQGREAISVNEYPLNLQFGALARQVALTSASLADLEDLHDQMVAATRCDEIVDSAFGDGSSLGIELSEFSFELNPADLDAACNAIRDAAEDKLFGVMRLSAPVTLSGEVAVIDSDKDGVADSLSSMQEFGGTLNILPEPLAPEVKVTFEATR